MRETGLLFARAIVEKPLGEYVISTGMRVRWVSSYSLAECKQHIQDCPSELAHTIVFLQMGPVLDLLTFAQATAKVWILNTEQMSRYIMSQEVASQSTVDDKFPLVEEVPFPFQQAILQFLDIKPEVGIMDYSMANIAVFRKLKPSITIELVSFIPKKYELGCLSIRQPLTFEHSSFDDEEKLTKEKLVKARKWLTPASEVIFIGDPSSQYRQNVLNKIPGINIVTNAYGAKRDKQIAIYTVVLNVHYGPTYKVFEELRCLSCVLAGKLVVSEDSDLDVHHPLYKFIIFAPYDKLAETTIDVAAQSSRYARQRYHNNPYFENLCADIRLYESQQNANLQENLQETNIHI